MLRTKLFALLAVLSFAFFAGIVLAQENEEVTAQDLGVSESKILPGSPFYFLKEWVRNIQSTFTFDAVAKAKLKERFANEKLIELKQLIEQNQNTERVESAIRNYQGAIDELKKVTEGIKERAEENIEVGKFLDKFVQQQTLHQQILEKLETKVSTTTLEKIRIAREQHLERFSEVMEKLEINKEKIQERLEQNLEEITTSTKEIIIQVRDRIMEKINQNDNGTTTGACITLWDPVCGKDGKTYSNECFAKVAGVEVDYEEVCIENECRPVCKAIGSRSEGWYDSCTKELIKYGNCGKGPCPLVVTYGRDPKTGACYDFPTPCDMPDDWQKVNICPGLSKPLEK